MGETLMASHSVHSFSTHLGAPSVYLGNSPFLAGYISFLETDNLISCPIRHFHESPLDYAQNTEPHERIRVSDRTLSPRLSFLSSGDRFSHKEIVK